MKRFLVFQHAPWEKPGEYLLRAAKSRRVRLDIAEVWHQPVPDPGPYDGLIVLGGPPNVDQEDQYAFLKEEKKAIRWVLENDRAYLGFCLGHQLLADALGAHVGPNFCCSIGFIDGRITKEGREHPFFHNVPQSIPLLKWHAQAVLPPLPKELEILATSKDCLVEAISVRERPQLIGLQFDNYAASYSDLKCWLESDGNFLASKRIDGNALIETARELDYLIRAQFEIYFSNFIKIIS